MPRAYNSEVVLESTSGSVRIDRKDKTFEAMGVKNLSQKEKDLQCLKVL